PAMTRASAIEPRSRGSRKTPPPGVPRFVAWRSAGIRLTALMCLVLDSKSEGDGERARVVGKLDAVAETQPRERIGGANRDAQLALELGCETGNARAAT